MCQLQLQLKMTNVNDTDTGSDNAIVLKNFNGLNVPIYGTLDDPLFKANDIGTLLGLKHIRSTINGYSKDDVRTMDVIDSIGRNQNTTMLTESGLYKILFASRKPVAKEFQNWVCGVIKEIRVSGKYEIEKHFKYDQQKRILDLHHFLVTTFANKNVVYIFKVRDISDTEYVVKLGETTNIKQRMEAHKGNYNNPMLIAVYPVVRCHQFEQFLLHATKEHHIAFDDLNSTRELRKISPAFNLDNLKKIVEDNINKYQHSDQEDYNQKLLDIEVKERMVALEQRELEVSLRKLEVSQRELDIEQTRLDILERRAKILNDNPILASSPAQTDDDTCHAPDVFIVNKKPTLILKTEPVTTAPNNKAIPRGPRIQCIDPKTMKLVKVYESYAECVRMTNASHSRIKNAIETCVLYKDHRWNAVDRNIDPDVIPDLPATVESSTQNVGYIAKMNRDATEIIKVYEDQKTAAKDNGFKTASCISKSVANKSVTQNHVYQLYIDVDPVVVQAYESKNNKPIFVGPRAVEKILAKTGQQIGIFSTKTECVKACKMASNKLKSLIDTGEEYHGYVYRMFHKTK